MSAQSHGLDPRAPEVIAAEAGSSFSRPIRLLRPDRRRAATAVYAFCRVVDDIVDEPGEDTAKRAGLDAWRAELQRCVEGAPVSVLGREIAWALRRFGLPIAPFEDTITGVGMDIGAPIIAPSFGKLRDYAHHVASPAGLLLLYILGIEHHRAPDLARRLGEAVQYTNILRDLREDAEIGRLYLPREYLDAHGIGHGDVMTTLEAPTIANACDRLGVEARSAYREAADIMSEIEGSMGGGSLTPVRLIAESYRAVLETAAKRGWPGLRGERVRIGGIQGTAVLLRVLVRGWIG